MCVLMQQLDNEPELSMSRYYFRETNWTLVLNLKIDCFRY